MPGHAAALLPKRAFEKGRATIRQLKSKLERFFSSLAGQKKVKYGFTKQIWMAPPTGDDRPKNEIKEAAPKALPYG